MKVEWERQERGWYTSDLGGICEETGGWYVYPIVGARTGPFRTLKAAKQSADDGFGDYGVKINGSQVISRTGSR